MTTPPLPNLPRGGDLERFNAAIGDARFAWSIRRCPDQQVVLTILNTSGLAVDCEPCPADVIRAARYVARAVIDPRAKRAAYDENYASVSLWNTRNDPDERARKPFRPDGVPPVFEDM